MTRRRIVESPSLPSLSSVFEAIRRDHSVTGERRPDALAEAYEAAALGDREHPHVAGTRADMTDLEFVTIDPPGAKDLDQAIVIAPAGGGWRIRYAIADVGAHVRPAGAIDAEARLRGETLYCPDMRIGLHPPHMAEGFASLLPGQRTKAVVWDLMVSGDGALESADVARAWVRSRAQYSYSQLAHRRPPEAQELVSSLARFGAARRAHLESRGAVTLPKPSQEVVVTEGRLSIELRAPLPIEDDNAQVSLLTGSAAALMMLDAGHGILRTMPPATDESLATLRARGLALGVTWPEGAPYATVLKSVDPETASGAAFLTAATSLFRGATWRAFGPQTQPTAAEQSHGALAGPYAHVTAPLRRLVDRFGTEVCLAHARGEEPPEWVSLDVESVAAAMTAGARVAKAIDRECTDAVEAAVLEPHLGELFEAVGLDRETVQVTHPPVLARCTGDVPVGQTVAVRLVAVDPRKGPRFNLA